MLPRYDRRELAAIFCGGIVGALARTGLAQAFPVWPGTWPWATFAVNVAGAFMLGYFVTRLQERLPTSAYKRPFLGTGRLRRADDVLDDAGRAVQDGRGRPAGGWRSPMPRDDRGQLPALAGATAIVRRVRMVL